MAIFNLVEIFKSIQGEGFNFGKPVVFIRLSDCNLNCYWCDTDWKKTNLQWSYDQIKNFCDENNCKTVIITGGEPTLNMNILDELVDSLLKDNFKILIETNGLKNISHYLDKGVWISSSPKLIYRALYKENEMIKKVSEMRIVVDPKLKDEKQIENILWFYNNIEADHYYLSPCEVNNNFDFEQLSRIYNSVNERLNDKYFKVSIQLHKLMNVR